MNTKTKAIIVFLAIFVAGAAVGAVFDHAFVQGRIRNIISQRDQGLLVPWRGPVLDRVSGEKRAELEKVFKTHGKAIAAIHDRSRKEIDAEFESLWKDISAIVPADVLAKLKDDLSRFPPPPGMGPGGMWPGRMGPGGPLGPGGPGQLPPPPPGKPGEKKRGPGNGNLLPGVY